MEKLNNDDLQTLLSTLADLYSDVSHATLPERTLAAMKKIVPGQTTSIDFFSLDGVGSIDGWQDAPLDRTEEIMEIYNLYASENPVFIETVIKRRTTAVKLTDFLPVRKFSNTNIYNEFYRLVESETQMAIALPVSSSFNMTCFVSRTKTDFSERDRQMLNLIAPHLVNAISSGFAYERLNAVLETKECGVISLDGSGNTQFVSLFAHQLLARYFAHEKQTNKLLPETIRNWLAQNNLSASEFRLPPSPLKIGNAGGELSISLMYNGTTHEQTLMLEEKKYLSPQMLESLNLTKREAQILFWIMKGKTDNEIAGICSISSYTVQKHAQHIYVKLGVETRTAATIKALEVLI